MVVQATLILFGSFFVMLFAGVPISAGIGIASIITAIMSGMDGNIFALTAAQRCFSGCDSFSLLALPFFSLGGNIMNKGGIAKRLVRLARLLVGWVPGYLAATNVLANMFFGAVSGSSVAAVSYTHLRRCPWPCCPTHRSAALPCCIPCWDCAPEVPAGQIPWLSG